jgi:acyl-CoA thioesterase
MIPFLDATTFTATGDGTFEGELTEDWLQGPGAFGGWSMAAAMRAMQAAATDGMRPLVLQAHFSARTKPGPVALTVDVARRGRRVATITAALKQGETTTTVLSSTWGAPAEPRVTYNDDVVAEAPAVDSIAPTAWQPMMPVFLKHFDVRWSGGRFPYMGADEAHVQGYIGLNEGDQTPYDASLIAAIADVFPPAAIMRADGFVAAASVSAQVSFAADPAALDLPPTTPLLVDARSHWSDAGYSEDLTSLWTPDGQLLARGHQIMALL